MSDEYGARAAAILAAVQAAAPDHSVTLNGKPDRPADHDAYAIAWCSRSRSAADSYTGRTDSAEMRWQVTTAGVDAETTEWLADRIHDYLTSTRITGASGWRFAIARLEYGQLPYVDETITGAPNVGKADIYTARVTRI